MADDLPFRAEYAKSGRSKCKSCKGDIANQALRLAAMVQSPVFDGKVPNWYHFMCFFGKQRPHSIGDIAHFDSLRWEDQEKIRVKIEGGGENIKGPSGKKSKKSIGVKKVLSDFLTEYAKSGKAVCRGCELKIAKDEVRVSKKDYETERARMYGPMDRWHHIDCFVKKRAELQFYDGGEDLPGFNTLSAEDKAMLKKKLPKLKIKREAEDEPDATAKKLKTENDELRKKQSKMMFAIRDQLTKNLTKSEMASLLEHNLQDIPSGESSILDRLADQMTFGTLGQCKVCKTGCFVYKSGVGYVCTGDLSEYTKCTNIEKEPKRTPFTVPEELREEYPFLKKYKYKGSGHRVILDAAPSSVYSAVKQENEVIFKSGKPLEGMSFYILGSKFTRSKKVVKHGIAELGGSVSSSVNEKTAAIITTSDEMNNASKHIAKAKQFNVQCVSEDFLDEVKEGGALLMIQKKNLAAWGSDPQDRIFGSKKSKFESNFTKSIPATQKLKLKGGAVVDPDSELVDCAHVYQSGKKIYNSILNLVDIVRGTNSYYKLQLLESDDKRSWWVFRAWGRIGTTIGGNKLEEMEDLQDAISHFEGLFEEKTGNRFFSNFTKLPGKFFPLEIDYRGDEELAKPLVVAGSKSKLSPAIQNLISLIFDVGNMKNAMVEFEIDLKKMPLGKLSKRQIEQAYSVLSEATNVMKSLESKAIVPTDSTIPQLVDCSNKFYTLIPHDFGMRKPPILDNIELINTKVLMLDNLREIELAYNLLKSDDDEDMKNADPVDKYYKKLKTNVEVLAKESEEYSLIEEYAKNTHASTHSHYSLKVQEVFKIARKGEDKRYKPFRKLDNRMLLWHGSRLTNYVGILSQGLRIAPPEAPVTGYMFGKGIYFADMVSKSANYCSTNKSNPTGLLLLCEVALGEMYECPRADYIEKLPKGKHSTKGLGKTCPDPAKTQCLKDGVKVPMGEPVDSGVKSSSLLYNEYIVYDVAQVNIKYLLRAEFCYKF